MAFTTFTLHVSVGWSAVLAFFVGGLLVGAFWYRGHQRYKKGLNRIEQAVYNLVFDGRGNALVKNIVARIEMGNKEAMRDWKIVNGVVMAVFAACDSSNSPLAAWLGYHVRVTKSVIGRLEIARLE